MDDFASPNPVPQPESQVFWDMALREELWLPGCSDCGRFHFYPRRYCPHCHADAINWMRASGTGALHSFAIVARAFAARFEGSVPYVPALVDLDEGVRMPSRLVNVTAEPGPIRVGMKLRVTFAVADNGLKIPVFEPDPAQG